MKIAGLQKMTLLDYPGHVACTVFLNGCDWRCPFCHNYELAEGKSPAVMDDTELLAFLAKRTGLLDGVAITGGEPCLYKELPDLFRRIRALGYGIKLDTNGLHPELLRELLDENLVDYVAMDIKNSPAKYAVTAGVEAVDLEERELTVLFDDRRVKYDVSELDELVLAYATTIHKAQGSEYPIAVMPVLMSHFVMLQRNLIYTGVTRAKKIMVIVGTRKALGYAIRNLTVTKRNTMLKERLQKEGIRNSEADTDVIR